MTSEFDKDIDRIPFKKLTGNFSGFGGNCGQLALAIYNILKDKYKISFIVYSNYSDGIPTPKVLQAAEPMIYHVGIFVHENGDYGVFLDGDGIGSWEQMDKDIMDWYDLDNPPSVFVYKYSEELHSLIDTETNWNVPWGKFYNLLNRNAR